LTNTAAPIIALLNLNGGVGKTTITAHLGENLAAKGDRILLVDLDQQASLSSLCLDDTTLRRCFNQRQMIQHYLGSPDPRPKTFQQCIVPGSPRTKCDSDIVSCADELEEVETALLARWVLHPEHDVRFHLRKALHSPAIQERYDYILLDCPSRFSVACVNALACSDYVLLPVLLDNTSWMAIPRLLKKLAKFQSTLLPNLSVLGIVANGTRSKQGWTGREHDVWHELRKHCNTVWMPSVHMFKTCIPDCSAVARATDSRRLTGLGHGVVDEVFNQLAAEVEQQIAQHRDRIVPSPST
jgi:chromosome partitioning protein